MKRLEEWRVGSTVNLGTRWGDWLASRPYHFTNEEKAAGTHWLGGRLKGSQSRIGSYVGETNLLSLSGIEPQLLDYPFRSQVAILTELWGLLSWKISRLAKPAVTNAKFLCKIFGWQYCSLGVVALRFFAYSRPNGIQTRDPRINAFTVAGVHQIINSTNRRRKSAVL